MAETRTDIITAADRCDDSWRGWIDSSRYEGSHDRELAAALTAISVNGFHDLELGSVQENGAHYAQIGPYVLRTDEQGFIDFEAFDSEREATDALNARLCEEVNA